MVRRRTVFEMNDGALFVTSLFTASFFEKYQHLNRENSNLSHRRNGRLGSPSQRGRTVVCVACR